jgi:hypothetical protein
MTAKEIIRNLKRREHMENLVHDLKKELKETERLILKYEKIIEKLNYDNRRI